MACRCPAPSLKIGGEAFYSWALPFKETAITYLLTIHLLGDVILIPLSLKIQISNHMGMRIQFQTTSSGFPILLPAISMTDKELASTLFLVTREF